MLMKKKCSGSILGLMFLNWRNCFSQVQLALSEEVAFIQPNAASIISFLSRISHRITSRLLWLEIAFISFWYSILLSNAFNICILYPVSFSCFDQSYRWFLALWLSLIEQLFFVLNANHGYHANCAFGTSFPSRSTVRGAVVKQIKKIMASALSPAAPTLPLRQIFTFFYD